jgi:hypothetical protein
VRLAAFGTRSYRIALALAGSLGLVDLRSLAIVEASQVDVSVLRLRVDDPAEPPVLWRPVTELPECRFV